MEKTARGFFVTFEGLDGLGKSTQLQRLAHHLGELGLDPVCSREPTDGPWGREARRVAREGRSGLTHEEELDLYLRDRAEHLEMLVGPALAAGRIVLVDRYVHSSIAYQGALGLDPDRVRALNFPRFPVPDLTLLFEAPVEVALERIRAGRPDGANVGYETEDFLRRVAGHYARMQDACLVRVDASGSPDEVAARVWYVVRRRGIQDLSAPSQTRER
ncbi:MAG: dTMP kinase [bacterium]|nr:dTMP kinase [bacterium]